MFFEQDIKQAETNSKFIKNKLHFKNPQIQALDLQEIFSVLIKTSCYINDAKKFYKWIEKDNLSRKKNKTKGEKRKIVLMANKY